MGGESPFRGFEVTSFDQKKKKKKIPRKILKKLKRSFLSGGCKTFSTTTVSRMTLSKSPFSRAILRIIINTDAELLIYKKVNQL